MPIVLYRVDERLIHGQVVLGWGTHLNPDRYVVVDDDLARSDWEQELYLLSLDDASEALFVSTTEAERELEHWQAQAERTVLLTRDVGTMLRLAETGGLAEAEVNLGGLHHAPGREAVRSYVHLDAADRARLRRLQELGVRVTARDLPDTHRVALDALLAP
jgi:PTS system mannose-specific IIB component/fructoselysine and glucoselysine-specific PTS system IIB component